MPKIERSHTWVVTSVNPEYFELMMRWLPRRPYPIVKHMIVITAMGRGDLVRRLNEIAARLRPQWPISVVTDQTLWDLSESYPQPLQDYMEVLGFKVMIPLWIPPPFFFTDDDVITLSDPSELLDQRTLWGSHSGLDSYGFKGMDLDEVTTWSRVINDPSLTTVEFNHNRTDAGVWHIPELDRTDYHETLYRFFDTPAAYRAAERGGNRFRLYDQRFLTTWMYKHNGDPMAGPVYRAWPMVKMPKSVPQIGTFAHYCASSRKSQYVEWLHHEADLRGYDR